MKIICIIPARYASTRFPGKPLADIAGHPMISWVYHRAKSVCEFDDVIVATDDERIFNGVKSFGGNVTMTPGELQSGSDRVAYVAKDLEFDVIVNLQGDEPLIAPRILSQVSQVFRDQDVYMATPIKKIQNASELENPNAAWVVKDKNDDALYFSRVVIPVVHKNQNKSDWLQKYDFYKHIGIYAYRKEFLLKLTQLPRSSLEKTEDLEQLRVLENGYKIRCVETKYQTINVDVAADIEKVVKEINKENIKLELPNAKM
jgi:3-deoxy-manno-octulosonate cytidylyltransferase (CMP-KDO synthetase)